MDPNHLPSSPLQHHHRHSASRPDNAAPQERPSSSSDTSNKLALPASSNAANASVNTTTVPPQWQAQEVSALPTTYNHEPAGVVYDTSDPWPENAIAGPSSQPWDQTLSQPLATTSRCPTPTPPPSAGLAPDSAVPSSSLLTSEPLNRSASSASSTPFPILAPSPCPTPRLTTATPKKLGKRSRSASLPLVIPDIKRFKHHHGPPTPSDQWRWALREPKHERKKLERADEAASGLRAEIDAVRRARKPTSVIIASRGPPINLCTLKSLDADEILKNPQLRHDLLFDALSFRPVALVPAPGSPATGTSPTSTSPSIPLASPTTTPVTPGGDVIPAGVDPTNDPRAMAAMADMYWESIASEIASGCRCSRWRVDGVEGKIDSAALVAKTKEKGCLCGGWKYDQTEAGWWAWQAAKLPSRLPELIKTLRDILVALMGSTTPCPSHFAHSFSREALAAHEATCPTVTHALVPELYNALDPEFVTIQVRRKVFGLGIFHTLGEAMKVHCAPIRDAMVNDMVETAMRGDVAGGLRKCFDCVEVMKLDIANHQVHALRPYLWQAAAQHELVVFRSSLTAAGMDLRQSITQRWIRDASMRVVKGMSPPQRSALMSNRPELVVRSLAEGVIELVSADWLVPGSPWPPIVPHRRIGFTGIQFSDISPMATAPLPESFKMDGRRLKNANAELVDLALTHMCVSVFATLLVRVRPDLERRLVKRFMADARGDVEYAFDIASAAGTNLAGSEIVGDLAFRLAARVYQPDFVVREGRPHVMSPDELVEVDLLAKTFNNFFTMQLRPDAPAFQTAMKQIRQAVSMQLTHRLLYSQWSPASSTSASSQTTAIGSLDANDDVDMEMILEDEVLSPADERPRSSLHALSRPPTSASVREEQAYTIARATELEAALFERCSMGYLRDEVKDLVQKVEPMVAFNLKVFMDIYAESGMVVGA